VLSCELSRLGNRMFFSKKIRGGHRNVQEFSKLTLFLNFDFFFASRNTTSCCPHFLNAPFYYQMMPWTKPKPPYPIWPLTQHCWVYSSVDSFILFVLWNTFKFMIIRLRKCENVMSTEISTDPGSPILTRSSCILDPRDIFVSSSWLLLEVTRILTSSFLQSFNPSLLSEFRLSRMEYDSYTLTSSLPVPFLNNHVIGSWFQMKSPESYDTSVCGAPLYIRELKLVD